MFNLITNVIANIIIIINIVIIIDNVSLRYADFEVNIS